MWWSLCPEGYTPPSWSQARGSNCRQNRTEISRAYQPQAACLLLNGRCVSTSVLRWSWFILWMNYWTQTCVQQSYTMYISSNYFLMCTFQARLLIRNFNSILPHLQCCLFTVFDDPVSCIRAVYWHFWNVLWSTLCCIILYEMCYINKSFILIIINWEKYRGNTLTRRTAQLIWCIKTKLCTLWNSYLSVKVLYNVRLSWREHNIEHRWWIIVNSCKQYS